VIDESPSLQRFRAARRRGFVFDFDGTLSEIVARPELARAAPGARAALARLAEANPLVAVVSGRPTQQLRELAGVRGVALVGMYGLPDGGRERVRVEAAYRDVERSAALALGAWVEDKGASLAVHYRGAADRAGAERVLSAALRRVAATHSLSVLRGKMVIELVGGEIPGKGAVVRDLVRTSRIDGCLYAGDDMADLDAFSALDGLADVASVRVAVRSEETPQELIAGADLVVDRPAGLVRLVSAL